MKLVKKLRKRWQGWRFAKQKPDVAKCRQLLAEAVKQGKPEEGGYVRNY